MLTVLPFYDCLSLMTGIDVQVQAQDLRTWELYFSLIRV